MVSHQGGLSSRWSFIRVSLITVFFRQCGWFSSGWSLITVVSNQDGLSSGWSNILVVIKQGHLSLGWSLIRVALIVRVVSHYRSDQRVNLSVVRRTPDGCHTKSLMRWSFIKVVFHQSGHSPECFFISVVSHQGGLSSGLSLIRFFLVFFFHQSGLSSEWKLIRVIFHQRGLSSERVFSSVVFH